MPRSTALDKFTYWLFADRIPLVKALILSNLVTFLLIQLGGLYVIERYLAYTSGGVLSMPWILVTHPLVGNYDIIGLLFAGYWLWVAGGSLERGWGTRTFGFYFFMMSAISALGLFAGSILTGVPTSTGGLWLPIAGVTIAFAMLNPEQQILFFFVIPLKLKYLALLDAVIVLVSYGRFNYGRFNVLLGVLALAGCAYSYWYVRTGRQHGWSRDSAPRAEVVRVHRKKSVFRWLNPLNWFREYRERKRLRDLFDK